MTHSWNIAIITLLGSALLALATRATLRLLWSPLPLWERVRVRGNAPRFAASADPQSGSAMLEFVLVFPVLLFLVLILAQVTLLMGANLFVHYAAFAATRSAIVQVPADHSPDEGPNVVINSTGHAKHDAIHRAAVFAVVPISGRLGSSNITTDDYIAGLTQYYNAYNQTPPSWINNLAADRLRYADANTLVSVRSVSTSNNNVIFTDLPEGASYTFGPKEPVSVLVTHRLRLSVPYVGMFFANGTLTSGTGRYTLVTAQYTLTNEGVYDALPPKPTLQRTDAP